MSEAPQAPVRWFFLAGYAHVGAAALVGVTLAAPSALFPQTLDVLLAGGGIVLIALALAYGFAPPFLKREVLAATTAPLVPLALILVADALAIVLALTGRDATRLAARVDGAAFLFAPLHVAASAWRGPAWRGGIALFAKDQPFRRGDQVAAACFAVALAGLALAGVLLLWLPRGLANTGLLALHLAFVLPFFVGALVFFLPRNAKRPLDGATLVLAALAVGTISAVALVGALLLTRGPMRIAATGTILATILFLFAAWRMRAHSPGPVLARARGALRGAAVLAVLAHIGLLLAFAGDEPGPLYPAAGYAALALDVALAVGVTLLGAPILLNAVPREGRWAAWASALAVTGLFLLAPAFEFARRGAFVGALVLAVAAALALWGLAPMRRPRREC